jgi:hypothetical protein
LVGFCHRREDTIVECSQIRLALAEFWRHVGRRQPW